MFCQDRIIALPLFFICLLCPAVFISSGRAETSPPGDQSRYLPIGHPAYDYLDRFQERGRLLSLNRAIRPYTRQQVLEAVEIEEASRLKGFESQWLDMLRSECLPGPETTSLNDSAAMTVVTRLEAAGNYNSLRTDSERSSLGFGFGGRFGRHIVYDARFVRAPHLLRFADSTDHRDPDVQAPYEEGLIRPLEGYLKADFGLFGGAFSSEIFFGRMARNWSPSIDHSLILGADASSFDHLAITLRSRHFVFTHLVAALDGINYRKAGQSEYRRARRYFSAHRLDIRVRDNLRFGISETVVYGGENSGFDPALSNPVTSFRLVGIQNKGDHANNTLLSLDGLYIAGNRLTLFGQFLFDDILRSDRFQDRWACDLGAGWRDLPGLERTTLNLRATVVSSFAYNTFQPYERYLLYGRPLGAPYGNDYFKLESSLRIFLSSRLDLKVRLVKLDRGAQRVAAPIEDFTNSSDLPYPTPLVEKTTEAALCLRWRPVSSVQINAEGGLLNRRNRDNRPAPRSRRGYAELTISFFRDIPLNF
jgi:capsule assembly protein Wzi